MKTCIAILIWTICAFIFVFIYFIIQCAAKPRFRHRAGVLVIKSKANISHLHVYIYIYIYILAWELENWTEKMKIYRQKIIQISWKIQRKSRKHPSKVNQTSFQNWWKSRPGGGQGGWWLPSPSWEAFGMAPERFLRPTWRGLQNRGQIEKTSMQKSMPAKIDFWWDLDGFWEGKWRQVGTKIDKKSMSVAKSDFLKNRALAVAGARFLRFQGSKLGVKIY